MGKKELQAAIRDAELQARQYEELIQVAIKAIATANTALNGPNDLDGKPWTSQTKTEMKADRDYYVRELGSMKNELTTHRAKLDQAKAALRDYSD